MNFFPTLGNRSAAPRFSLGGILGMTLALLSPAALAADVTVTPSAGSGFTVTDASGNTPRLRVQESGTVSVPGLPAASQQNTPLCFNNSTGAVGPCAPTTTSTAANNRLVLLSQPCTGGGGSTSVHLTNSDCPAPTTTIISGGCESDDLNVPVQSSPAAVKGHITDWYCFANCSAGVSILAYAVCAP